MAIAINIGIGIIVKALNLPLYLDSVGTIISTLIFGWRVGATVGIMSFVITAIFFNPVVVYFVGTQAAIAIYIDWIARRGFFNNAFKTLISGLGLGVVAAVVSAPVIIWVFQGATGNGAALVTSFFAKVGNQIIESILLSGFSIEPIDKTLQCLLSLYILKGLPKTLLNKFPDVRLKKNGLSDG